MCVYEFIGSKFWKSAKVIRAYLSAEYEAMWVDDDDDFRTTDRPQKRRKLIQSNSQHSESTRQDVSDELKVLGSRITALEERMNDHDGKRKAANALRQIFQCLICQEPAYKDNVCVSTCCDVVLGHQTCVDRWLVERTICPHCRADHDFSSVDNGLAYKIMPNITPLRCLLDDYADILM